MKRKCYACCFQLFHAFFLIFFGETYYKMATSTESNLRRKIKAALILTIVGLIISGLSAFPLLLELKIALHFKHFLPTFLIQWWMQVMQAIKYTHDNYPLVLYGYDWLGFAHFLIAIAFFGPLRDPIKNQWVVQWGMIASALTIVMALIAERFRDIPFFWSVIDAVIGVGAFIILWLANKWINELKNVSHALPAEA